MAYSFVKASSQWLNTGSTPVTAAPLTIAALFTYKTWNDEVVAGIDASSSDYYFLLNLVGPTTAVRASTYSAGQNFSAKTFTGTTNEYMSGVAVFSASNSRMAYADGSAGTLDTGSRTPQNLNRIVIGARRLSTVGAYANMPISDVAIWNAALNTDEINSLYKRFSPRRIRPQSLVFYAPLIRDLQDTRGGLTITNNNSATVADHPRVY